MFGRLSIQIRKPLQWLMMPLALLVSMPAAHCFCGRGSTSSSCCPAEARATPKACPHCHKGDVASPAQPGVTSPARNCNCQIATPNVDVAQVVDAEARPGRQVLAALPIQPPLAASAPQTWNENSGQLFLPPADKVVVLLRLTI